MDEEEQKTLQRQPERDGDKPDEWLCFKNSFEDLTSKVHLKKQFYEKTKLNSKKMRSNKKNQSKASTNTADSPMLPGISEDLIYQTAIPNTITYSYEGLGSRIYNCNFTNDGKYILVTSQTGTAFFKFEEDSQIALTKVITCSNVNWAITDSNISSDNRFMIHSTLSPNVHMFDLEKSKYVKQFSLKTGNQNQDDDDDYYSWYSMIRVFSLKLSGDNKEVIAGCGRMQSGAPIQVYDLVKNKLKHSIIAHSEDINSICYVDRSNSSIFISGSDDGLCKLWDTRILENNKPVGIFYGHFAGLTCVSSKEDNRYFISNSKDQSIKLWDLRKSTTEKKEHLFMKFDYRYQRPGQSQIDAYKKRRQEKNYPDQSIMSFEGHSVVSTLIRCHFSPMCGTGQRYVYSGSHDGKVYIYDTVDGTNVSSLEVPKNGNQAPVVRDCAWHPFSQNLISTSFSGDFHRWEYMDLRDAEKIVEEGEWETDEEAGEQNNAYGLVVNNNNDDDDEDDEDYDGDEFAPVDDDDDEIDDEGDESEDKDEI